MNEWVLEKSGCCGPEETMSPEVPLPIGTVLGTLGGGHCQALRSVCFSQSHGEWGPWLSPKLALPSATALC